MLARTEVSRPPWFPDWSGQACAVVATGQSVKDAKVGLLRGRMKVIAIKEAAVHICPWADAVYGCDAPWWKYRKGMQDFAGLRIGWDPKIPYPWVHRIQIKRGLPNSYSNDILVDTPGLIGGGRNSGFQAVNLAIQFGAARILLVGFDLSGEHYYGRNTWFKAGNPDKRIFEDSCKVWLDNKERIAALGVEVVNASVHSALKAFPRYGIEDTIKFWGL